MVRRMAAEQVEKAKSPRFGIPALCQAPERRSGRKDSFSGSEPDTGAYEKGKTTRDPDATRLGISVLQETGAIRECEAHGWMQDRADPHARQRAFDIARRDPPTGVLTGCRRRRDRRGA
jgi:hypothetical protein